MVVAVLEVVVVPDNPGQLPSEEPLQRYLDKAHFLVIRVVYHAVHAMW